MLVGEIQDSFSNLFIYILMHNFIRGFGVLG